MCVCVCLSAHLRVFSFSVSNVVFGQQILTVPVKAVIAVGTLTSHPKHIVLPPSFPVGAANKALRFFSGPQNAAQGIRPLGRFVQNKYIFVVLLLPDLMASVVNCRYLVVYFGYLVGIRQGIVGIQ